MQKEMTKQFSPDEVIAALLTFLPSPFPNDPEKIHETIRKLQQKGEYKELLEDFEFLDYSRFPYSPLLGRILNRLQESRLLASLNPDYKMYVMEEVPKEAIRSDLLGEGKKLNKQRDKLAQIASELGGELTNNVEP